MKNDLVTTDLLEVRKLSLFTNLDSSFLLDLYVPLMGASSFAIYESLIALEAGQVYSHDKLLTSLQLSVGEFVQSLQALEATGLIKTYFTSDKGTRLFSYCLFAPLSPRSFFADPLFAGTLRKYIGKERCEKIAKKYSLDALPDNYQNVSESFLEYFSPDFNDKSYGRSLLSSGENTAGEPSLPFNEAEFFARLLEVDPRFTSLSFSREELDKIAKFSALYGYSSAAMGDIVKDCYSFSKAKGQRVDFVALEKECQDMVHFSYLKDSDKPSITPVHGDTSLAKSLRAMQSLSPTAFLSKLQKGTKPAPSDVSLAQELVVEMGLAPEVVNSLFLYVLSKNDNTLPKRYTEKVAASLKREGITTALDALNYFSKGRNKNKTVSMPRVVETPKPLPEVSKVSMETTNEASPNDFDNVVSSLHWKGSK